RSTDTLFLHDALPIYFGLTVQGVGIKVELGVQSNDVAVAVTVQRVDFYQGGVGFHVALIELLENIHGLSNGAFRHFNGASHLLRDRKSTRLNSSHVKI